MSSIGPPFFRVGDGALAELVSPPPDGSFVDKEVPTGAIDGVNTVFVLDYTPIAGSEHVYLNGPLQISGYTITDNEITMGAAPLAGDELVVSYRKAT